MGAAKVGFHVSISGGIANSVDNATKIGCTAFQIFSRNPKGWVAKPLDGADVKLFKEKLGSSGIPNDCVMVHMPYLPNLSSPENEVRNKSIETLTGEIQRCEVLGIPSLVIHLGSRMGETPEFGIAQLTKAILAARVRAGKAKGTQPVTILLENNAGQKNGVGGTFEELRIILDTLGTAKGYGVCLDTCHLFASGYDLRTSAAVEKTLESFQNTVGAAALRAIHLNDSKGGLKSNIDRHEHIGLGSIGLKGIGAFLNHKMTRGLPIIMETPVNETRGDEENLKIVRGLLRY
ncbi:MAG: deoxyribonuclease IV [Nitrososphaera sp.]|nr:deoxyribonuclease IV [Nitrososphaera sp.]